MGNKCSSRHRACGMLVAVCAAIQPVVANALDPAIDRIEAIERHIRELQSELQRLKSPRFSSIGQPGCTRGAGELGAENSAWVIKPP
jgi:hypothetical protein